MDLLSPAYHHLWIPQTLFMSQAYFLPNQLNPDVMFPSKCCFPRHASNGHIYFPSFHIAFMLQELIKMPQAGKLFQIPADRMTVKMF